MIFINLTQKLKNSLKLKLKEIFLHIEITIQWQVIMKTELLFSVDVESKED
jgi:hypothetical protein